MHLVVGVIALTLAKVFASLYRLMHFEWMGRRAVRFSSAAFIAGAGLDDAGIDMVESMGDDGVRLLEDEAERQGKRSLPAHMLMMLRMRRKQ